MTIIKKSTLITTTWAGGTTTQLAIGPAGADYTTRNFGWRISTATVDLAESKFTPLPSVFRHLMVLSGNLTLQLSGPSGDEQVHLAPYKTYAFNGGDAITGLSPEPVIDFNLMTQDPYYGQMESLVLSKSCTIANIGDTLGLYVVSGLLTSPIMETGDFLLTEESVLHLEGEAQLALVYISQN